MIKKAKKSLGQNFINDKNICNKIIDLADITNKLVIEIGPGYGFLTDIILKKKPKKVFLIEKDKELYDFCVNKYSKTSNINILNEDVMKVNFKNFKNVIIISNLPYNISSRVILKLLKYKFNIKEMIFMIQKEVSKKFDYELPKANKYKFLTKLSSDFKRCFDVPPTVFKPKPKVISTVVNIKLKKNTNIDWDKAERFSSLIFKNKRKKINNKIKFKNFIYLYNKRTDELTADELLTIYNSF